MPNAPQSCCVAVFCPWLIAAPVERASACNAEQRLFPHTISGIVMSNQNAARPRGTLQPPHYSVRFAFILITARAYASFTGISKCGLPIMPFSFQQYGFKRGLVFH